MNKLINEIVETPENSVEKYKGLLGMAVIPCILSVLLQIILSAYKNIPYDLSISSLEAESFKAISFLSLFRLSSSLLFCARILNILPLGLLCFVFFRLLEREKNRRIYRIIAVLTFLSLYTTQFYLFQSSGAWWGLLYGTLGLFLFFSLENIDESKPKSILVSFILALPVYMTGDISYGAFALATLGSKKIGKTVKILACFQIVIFLVLYFFLSSHWSRLWSLANISSHLLPFLRDWQLWASLICLSIGVRRFGINPTHPASILSLSAIFLGLLSSGFAGSKGFLVASLGLCWVMTLLLNYLCGETKQTVFLSYCLYFLVLTTVLSPMLLIQANSQYLIRPLSGLELLTDQSKKFHNRKIFLEDPALARFLGIKKISKESRKLAKNPVKNIKNGKFDFLVLSENYCSEENKLSFCKKLEENYVQVLEIPVFDSVGFLYKNKDIKGYMSSKFKEKRYSMLDPEKLTATFSPR